MMIYFFMKVCSFLFLFWILHDIFKIIPAVDMDKSNKTEVLPYGEYVPVVFSGNSTSGKLQPFIYSKHG